MSISIDGCLKSGDIPFDILVTKKCSVLMSLYSIEGRPVEVNFKRTVTGRTHREFLKNLNSDSSIYIYIYIYIQDYSKWLSGF